MQRVLLTAPPPLGPEDDARTFVGWSEWGPAQGQQWSADEAENLRINGDGGNGREVLVPAPGVGRCCKWAGGSTLTLGRADRHSGWPGSRLHLWQRPSYGLTTHRDIISANRRED